MAIAYVLINHSSDTLELRLVKCVKTVLELRLLFMKTIIIRCYYSEKLADENSDNFELPENLI